MYGIKNSRKQVDTQAVNETEIKYFEIITNRAIPTRRPDNNSKRAATLLDVAVSKDRNILT